MEPSSRHHISPSLDESHPASSLPLSGPLFHLSPITKVARRAFFRKWWAVLLVVSFWSLVGLIGPAKCHSGLVGGIQKKLYTGGDFQCIYYGGACAAWQQWPHLYHGLDAAFDLIGNNIEDGKDSKSATDERKRNTFEFYNRTKNITFRAWLWPPPAAFLFAPLAHLGFETAQHIWFATNLTLFTLLLVLLRNDLNEHPSCVANLLVLATGFGVPAIRSFQEQNIDVPIALAIYFAIYALRNGRTTGFVFGVLFIGMTKGFSIVWTPLLLLWRRYRILATIAAGTAIFLAASFIFGCSTDNYVDFFSRIIFRNGEKAIRYNIRSDGISVLLAAALEHGTHSAGCVVFPSWLSFFLNSLFWGGLCGVYALNARRLRGWTNPIPFAELSLFATLLLYQAFSMPCWDHYRMHLLPFVPTCLRFCRQKRRSRWLFYAAMIPFFCFHEHYDSLYFHFHDLLPLFTFVGLAIYPMLIVFCFMELTRKSPYGQLLSGST